MDTPSTHTQHWLGEAAFVHRLARALLRDPDLAHDVAQDALTAALQHRSPSLDLRSWLAAVTRRLAGHAWRAQRERPAREAQAARPEADDREEHTARRLRLHRQLMDAVLSLPEPYRTAVTLRYLDGLSPRVIARRCGVSAATARQHVHRGLFLLRGRLDAEFGDRRAWSSAFAGLGLGGAAPAAASWILPVLAMNKLAVATLVAVALTIWAFTIDSVPTPPVAEDTPPLVAATGNAPPLPAASSQAVPPAARRHEATASLLLDVLADTGEPIAGADVRTWTDAGVVVHRRSDAGGHAIFPAQGGPGGVLVQAAGWQPLLRILPAMTGGHRLVLPAGKAVAGVMLVDGAPAPAGLRLSLFGGPPLEVPASAPRAIADLLTTRRPRSEALTTTGGRFAFAGLPADWSGSLHTPSTHWFLPQTGASDDDGYRLLRLQEPRDDLVLATTKLATVEGRVVWDDDGERVARPWVTAWCRFADGSNSPDMVVVSDENGRFAAGFYPGSDSRATLWLDPARRSPLAQVKLDVGGAGSTDAVNLVLEADRLNRPGEELVVRLRRAPVTHFLVLDEAGTPVRDARVKSQVMSDPTGADGRGSFAGRHDRALVGAPGHMVVPARPRAAAAGTAADPLVFVLAADNTLTLRLRTPSGGVPAARTVWIHSAGGDLFAGRRYQSELDRVLGSSEAGGSRSGGTQPDGTPIWHGWRSNLTADARGEAVLHSLEPGVSCTVVVQDALGAELALREFVTPAAGRSLALELVVAQEARRLRGRVLDSGGRGIEHAVITVSNDRREVVTHSQADGAFEQAALAGTSPLRVRVRASGFAPQQRDGVSGDAELVFRLEPGRTVTVRVEDPAGELVPVYAQPDFGPLDSLPRKGQELQPGEMQWSELPSGLVTFTCQLGGRRFEVRHDTAEPTATIRVPRPARVVVAAPSGWPRPKRGGGALMAVATRLDEPEPPVDLALDRADEPAKFLLPGRWRIALVLRERGGEPQELDVPQGPAEEVVLQAGELVRVQLR